MFINSLEFMEIMSTSFTVMVFSSLYMFVMLTPQSIFPLHVYSSKLSEGKNMSISDVLAVSSVTINIPSGLKYMFTSFKISFKTSNVDFIAAACTVTNFILKFSRIISLYPYMPDPRPYDLFLPEVPESLLAVTTVRNYLMKTYL